jgi:REP element-mobilizing transposase RayT
MRKTPFVQGNFYHIYNRGVDKRNVFIDYYDLNRFLQCMSEFNCVEPIGSIYENSFKKDFLGHTMSKLVNFVAYCLNPNHYHFILEPLVDNGIEKFMQRLGNGYTKYFNNKNNRSGVLFQGKFKSIHISSNEYLLRVSAYVNLNNKVHSSLGYPMSKSSWDEYVSGLGSFCKKDIVIEQFNNIGEYKNFCESTIIDVVESRRSDKEVDKLFLEN